MTENNEESREVRLLADEFLDQYCEIFPLNASEEGFSKYDDQIGDLSPEAEQQYFELARSTITKLNECEINSSEEKLCYVVLKARCDEVITQYENNDWIRGLNVITNPLDAIHSSCYNIDEQNPDAIAKRADKISKIPEALETFKESLIFGVENDSLPRRTQLTHLIENCRLYANDKLFVDQPAHDSFLELGTFIESEIVPRSKENDYVGEEIYSRFARTHLGKDIDLKETYDWGWQEIKSILEEIELIVNRLNPEGDYLDTMHKLNEDAQLRANSPQELKNFLQGLLNESLEQLDGKHFDIDPRLKTIEACLIEESGSSAMYYSAPSDDFSRPGRTYYPLNGKTVFPLWEEVTTCYHEGLPGHHLHLGAIKCSGDQLSTFQKTSAYNAGFGEGWALYAERLMVELGFNNKDEFVFGMLNASLFRALRVVMDIGLHCQYKIPDDAPDNFEKGTTWNTLMAIDLLENFIGLNSVFAKDEVHRYLGWIGQAISYKVGEKTIRDIRQEQEARLGSDFSLKEFHSQMLNIGHVGLGTLEDLFTY